MPPFLEAEIKGNIQDVDVNFFNRVVKQRVRRTGVADVTIAKFVQNSGLYDNDTKRWSDINETTIERTLYEPFHQIFQEVVATFKLEEREAIPTYKTKIQHIEGDTGDSSLKTFPDLFIYGSGHNFHLEDDKDEANYKYCASPCEVKTEHNLKDKVVTQVGVYARQCFMQQGNRRYVCSLVMTEKRAFLLQSDRNGVLRSQFIDIHENPKDFVYLILLVSSPNCTTLGFDASICWKVDERYIRTLDEIIGAKPFFQRRAIRGGGMFCWLGGDPRGQMRIKDPWQAQGREPEHTLLTKVKGLPGIGQMVAFEPENVTIAGLRGMEGQEWPTGMADRLFHRIVRMAYGKQINKFTDRKQFLYAFRDAVAGHQNMWDINVIHRDISINNILIGEEDAEAGWRGSVIDMDMAVFRERMTTIAAMDFRTGMRTFQSLFVMCSELDWLEGLIPLPHDYLDDLESFFYVYCWVCMHHSADGKPLKKPPLTAWESQNPEFRIAAKSAFLSPVVIKHNEVNHTFGKVFQDLLDALRGFFLETYKWKTENRNTMTNKMDAMKEHSTQHYAEFLGHIDTAVMALEEEENGSPSSSPAPPPPPEPASTHSPHSSQQTESSSSMKRTRDERDAGETEMDVDGAEVPPASKRLL
ncbi:hypothetical protein NLJ89_g9409 [Agrocybe chaxingu]|uniref:Fungal-type protein kinase domain-containing protein n=1 Tax=Agrocybe chaxingu TaxID=84603 RepID=A0A9W8JTE8_9AGAR|nr:hypothetical protein NLJ89_g9409 [Agrocybe chaxingu]